MRKTTIAIIASILSTSAFADFSLTAQEARNTPLSILPYGSGVAVSTSHGKTIVIEKQGINAQGQQIVKETVFNLSMSKILKSQAVAYGIECEQLDCTVRTDTASQAVTVYTTGKVDSLAKGWATGLVAFKPKDSDHFDLPFYQANFVFGNQIALGQTDYVLSPEVSKIISRSSVETTKETEKEDNWSNLKRGLTNSAKEQAFYSSGDSKSVEVDKWGALSSAR
ncbi:hypothetical protein [Salinicola rhizosphaerae]|uniref:Uncharacterized protein n=1 Tax=Salinicola rhizosphaerae TaxID=1443141 RepID=A0ABQ3DY90_9GAMM|nr:hypothetical protein [Salinicola rhizosphaerae]GHB12835.1 hypothetical protein GCM10009038_08560 [Salinicola rhizosphaerae]